MNTTATSFIMIYLLTLLLIATDMVPMSVAALIGALFTVWIGLSYGVFTYEEAASFIDMKLLGLLIGTMIVMEVAYRSGLFRLIALYTIRVAGGDQRVLFVIMCITSAAVSMFLSDSTALLLIAAAVTAISKVMNYDPVPYFVSASIMVNLGGTSTLIGSVSNMIIGLSAGLSFSDFIAYLSPCELILWMLTTLTLYMLYKSKLKGKNEVPKYDPWEGIEDRKPLIWSAILLAVFLGLFTVHKSLGIPPEAVALGCAVLALAIGRVDPTEVFRSIDWETIFFLGGFFIIVGGLEKTGLLNDLAGWFMNMTGGGTFVLSTILLWISGLTSTVVSNIAVALTFTPIIRDLGAVNTIPIWSALVLGSNLGGAATPLSGVVTIMTLGALKREGFKISLAEFTKAGVLTTFTQLLFANLYILIRFGL
ncbi:anion permease [Candidatus Bathyarchaeota archaeon]|nr:anion permease [Candidatus Bathyarchaeota archaeon]